MDKYSLQKHTSSILHTYLQESWLAHLQPLQYAVLTGLMFTTYSWGTLSIMCLFGPQLWSNRHLLVSSGFLESAKNLVRHVHLLHCHLLLLLWRLSWKIVVRSTCFIMFLYSPSSPPSSSSSSSSSEMSISSGLSADCISCTALLCSSPRTNMMFEPTAGKGKTCLISCFLRICHSRFFTSLSCPFASSLHMSSCSPD